MKLVTVGILSILLSTNVHAEGIRQLHDFGSWGVITWKTETGVDVYWAQTALDSKHVLEEDDDGDHLRFGCDAASRPLTVLLLREASGSALWTESYAVDWRVGNLPPMHGQGGRMQIFDLFDAPMATEQLLEGERSNDTLVLRLRDPDKGFTDFDRRLVGTEWPKLYVAKLDGFKEAHDFIVEKCNEEPTQESSANDAQLESTTTRGTTEAPPEAFAVQPERSPKVANTIASVRSSAIERCREAMGDYGSAMVKACVDQDVAAYQALVSYSAHEAMILRCRRNMESYGWAMIKACVDQDIEAEGALRQ